MSHYGYYVYAVFNLYSFTRNLKNNTVNIKETRMLMPVLIYDYLLLIYLDTYFAKVLQKVAYIVDAQSQMGNLVLFDENPMQTFVVDVLKVMLFGNKEFYLSPAFYFAVIIALNSSKSTWLSPLTSA